MFIAPNLSYKLRESNMPPLANIEGKRFGRLVALRRCGPRTNGGYKWECICDCGNTTYAAVGYLNIGKVKSCGCLYRELASGFHLLRRQPGAPLRSLFIQYQSNARKRGLEFDLPIEKFKALTSSRCYYCNRSPETKIGTWEVYTYNGLDRKINSLGYTEDNSVPCCWTCNQLKSTFNDDIFLKNVRAIAAFHLGIQ